MSDEPAPTAEAIEVGQAVRGLAYLCAHLKEISAAFAGDTPGEKGLEALERLRSALRSGTNFSGPLTDIHRALLHAGDALGVYGRVRGLSAGLTLAGIDDGEPLEIVYRCPVGRCPRTVPGPAVTPPQCGVVAEALRWGQL